MDEPTFSRILDGIYDAASDRAHWPAALERIGRELSCSYIGLIDRNPSTLEGRSIAVGVDLASQREYFDVWSKRDVLRQWKPAYRVGVVETDEEILPRHDLLRSDFYNGFMKSRDMHAVMRMTLSDDGGFRRFISMSRPISLGNFEVADVELCRHLIPHLQRAAKVTQRLEASDLTLTTFSEVLEQSATGIVLLSQTGCVVFANRAARMMAQAADSFRLRNGRIEALNRRDDAQLQGLIAAATNRIGRPEAPRGGVARLSRMSEKPDLAIAVAPLASKTPWIEIRPVAFVLITDPEVMSTRPESMVRDLFGLSAAEVRVAERLMMGESPEQAAEALNIRTSTARWHLAALYRKTSTSRQTQLIRLLMSVPQL